MLTFIGPPHDDPEVLAMVPSELARVLTDYNGFVLHSGALHVFGASRYPHWHSIREAWIGENALWRTYDSLLREDVPFGQDCIGFPLFLRNGEVHQLDGETGDLDALDSDLESFLVNAIERPREVLGIEPLLQFEIDGKSLSPGYVLAEYPYFCTVQSADGVRLDAVPSEERRQALAGLYKTLKDVPIGGAVDVEIV